MSIYSETLSGLLHDDGVSMQGSPGNLKHKIVPITLTSSTCLL